MVFFARCVFLFLRCSNLLLLECSNLLICRSVTLSILYLCVDLVLISWLGWVLFTADDFSCCSLQNFFLRLFVVSCGWKFLKKPQDTFLILYWYPFYSPKGEDPRMKHLVILKAGAVLFSQGHSGCHGDLGIHEKGQLRSTARSIIFSSLKILWKPQIMLHIEEKQTKTLITETVMKNCLKYSTRVSQKFCNIFIMWGTIRQLWMRLPKSWRLVGWFGWLVGWWLVGGWILRHVNLGLFSAKDVFVWFILVGCSNFYFF